MRPPFRSSPTFVCWSNDFAASITLLCRTRGFDTKLSSLWGTAMLRILWGIDITDECLLEVADYYGAVDRSITSDGGKHVEGHFAP